MNIDNWKPVNTPRLVKCNRSNKFFCLWPTTRLSLSQSRYRTVLVMIISLPITYKRFCCKSFTRAVCRTRVIITSRADTIINTGIIRVIMSSGRDVVLFIFFFTIIIIIIFIDADTCRRPADRLNPRRKYPGHAAAAAAACKRLRCTRCAR